MSDDEQKPKHAGGRPTKRDPATVQKLEAAFHNGYNIEEACNYAGIVKQTYYNWCDEDPEFLDEMTTAQKMPNMRAKTAILDAIEKGEWRPATWWLDRKAKDEFSTRTEVVGKDGEPVQFELVEDPVAEARRIVERAEKRANAARRKTAGDPAKILEPED